jgi:hypothetical protein
MYTEKNFNDDLFQLTQPPYYVKFKLLKDYTYGQISQQEFAHQLAEKKDKDEINQVLNSVNKLLQMVQQNGGKFDEDPNAIARKLRKEGKLQDAFNKIVPYIQENQGDEDAEITFGWVMYDYLKRSENDLNTYCNNLKMLNDIAHFSFSSNNNEFVTTLLNSVLWSVRRVAMKGEMAANRVLIEFLRFVDGSAVFIEQRGEGYPLSDNDASPSRLLIKELRNRLHDNNYFLLMDMIGFCWFDNRDYMKTSFTDKDGKIVESRPLAETTLNYHAKKLIKSDEQFATQDRVNIFLPILTRAISSHPDYEWLPYYRIQLLMKIGDSEQAFSEVTEFARNKNRDFWVWDLISDLVDGDEKFNCLCAGLLCKTKAEMVVGLQKKAFPHLLERGSCPEAKLVLEKMIDTRTRNGWKVSPELLAEREQNWYKNCDRASTLNNLQPFAEEAKRILYQSMPFTDVFITYINEDKGAISFLYIVNSETREGFFYKDSIGKSYAWKVNASVRLKMISDKKHENLFSVFDVESGDNEFAKRFVKPFSGTFEKVKEFGFIRDVGIEVFVNPVLVKEHRLLPFSTVSGTVIKKRDKKKNCMAWFITSIDSVVEPVISDYEKEVTGEINIATKGFGFVDECYVPAELIKKSGYINDGDYVKAKAQKSWDKSKMHWSWKATEIISVDDEYDSWAMEYGVVAQDEKDEEYRKWAEEIDQRFKSREEDREADYLKWVENGLSKSHDERECTIA